MNHGACLTPGHMTLLHRALLKIDLTISPQKPFIPKRNASFIFPQCILMPSSRMPLRRSHWLRTPWSCCSSHPSHSHHPKPGSSFATIRCKSGSRFKCFSFSCKGVNRPPPLHKSLATAVALHLHVVHPSCQNLTHPILPDDIPAGAEDTPSRLSASNAMQSAAMMRLVGSPPWQLA
jgi:hypothetical protein